MAALRRRFPTGISTFVDYDSHGLVGFTDIVSNTVVLDDLSPLSRIPEILSGSLELSFLPGIAHEAAHHACFDSPVGLALSSLWQSSSSLWWEQIGTEIPQQPARDVAVALVANIVLQPLLEGIALFSEHDLFTGASPVISRVTQRVAPLFSHGRMSSLLSLDRDILRALGAENPDALYSLAHTAYSLAHTAVLKQARCSGEWTERKRLLLSQPLRGSNRYLLGYLAVKGMHAALVPICPELSDPELFFVAVVRHFLHDKPLTSILLRFRNRLDDPEAAYLALGEDMNDLLIRFQDLCDELYSNAGRVAQEAIESVVGPSSLNAGRPEAGDELLMALRTVGTFNIVWPRLMKHRQDFRFSFQRVSIRLAKNGEATILDSSGSQEICRVIAVDGITPSDWEEDRPYVEFEGSIEAIQLRDLNTFVVCILNHDRLVAVFDCRTGQWNSEQLVELLGDMPSAIAVEGAMYAFAEWQSKTRGQDRICETIDFYEKQAREAVDHLYPQLVCRGWEASKRERFVEAFDSRGVFSCCQAQDEGPLAELSLTAGLGCSIADAAQIMKTTGPELRQLVSKFNEAYKQVCGFEPFALTDNLIRSRV